MADFAFGDIKHPLCVCVCAYGVCVCVLCVCVCLYLHVNGLTGWSLDNGSEIISTLSQKIWPLDMLSYSHT